MNKTNRAAVAILEMASNAHRTGVMDDATARSSSGNHCHRTPTQPSASGWKNPFTVELSPNKSAECNVTPAKSWGFCLGEIPMRSTSSSDLLRRAVENRCDPSGAVFDVCKGSCLDHGIPKLLASRYDKRRSPDPALPEIPFGGEFRGLSS